MSENTAPISLAASRGPAAHNVRDQIIQAAQDHFSHYGYAKTTVADLAREIGFSKAYIYRFFDSKQAIGEAICSNCLSALRDAVALAVAEADSATEKLRIFIRSLSAESAKLFFVDRKLYEIASYSASERWNSARDHWARIRTMVHDIVTLGRDSGEFERKTPIDEVCRAILYAISPFADPLSLERHLDLLPDGPAEISGLILRSLAP
ncbi:TetR/AcrR family transcriptional regulator [Sphingomonas elodea]|uniref:TetR/AcrR family transcriptional regulator n=1 Tax=Sphingomonas elodea TaxID=179878 RepID=UPI0002630A82|nr:TetR/AcrR family transcriptional regulator [Sphingomonas elodea]